MSDLYVAVTFWESNFLTSLITFIVGFVAYGIYKKQQLDNKKAAASIIMLEIKNAQTQLIQAKEAFTTQNKKVPEAVSIMNPASWSKYSFLFVAELTTEEWGQINIFYEQCFRFNEIIKYNDTFFKKNEEQIRINLHQALAEYTKGYLGGVDSNLKSDEDEDVKSSKNKELYDEYAEVVKGFYTTFMSELTQANSRYFYAPDKTINDFDALINNMKLDLSTSSVGIKLQEIIDQNFRSRLFKRMMGKQPK